MKPKRSPLFYVGDKYKLMPQLLDLFPSNIEAFIDVFAGGGSVSLNTPAKKYIINDNNPYIISLHRFLMSYHSVFDLFREYMYNLINEFKLSCSELGINDDIIQLKKIYKKTYFSKYNKPGYLQLRDCFNINKEKTEYLYLLLIYGFNHMIRFNRNGEFNLPVGNVDWNKNVSNALRAYFIWSKQSISLFNEDFEALFDKVHIGINDFCYFDPPYLITNSEYNSRWSEVDERRLYTYLDLLNEKGVKWGLSNMLRHKEKNNDLLEKWSERYCIYNIRSNYISKFDNSIKTDSREIYVTNYGR